MVAASLPGLLLLWVMACYYQDFVSDDAYISFRYAKHLATGQGLEWNPGYRVEGYSNFLWVVLAAAGRALTGVAVPEVARVLTWGAALLTVVLVVAVAAGARARPSVGLLALTPLPMALSFPYQYWTAMRLETALFGLLLLLAPALFLWEERRGRGPMWPSALAYLALAMTRPEGSVFIAVPGLYLLALGLRAPRTLPALLRRRAAWLALFFGGVALYHGWRVAYFGDILPNTYYAKVGGQEVLERGYLYVLRFAVERPYHLVLLVLALALGGPGRRATALLLGTVALLVAVVVLEGGDWMREWRLLMPAVPLLCAALGAAVQRRTPELSRAARASALLGMGLLAAGVQGTMGTPLNEWKAALDGTKRDLLINLEGELTVASRHAAEYIMARSRPGDIMAVNHAGALPFYADLPTIDMVGLNDLHIARTEGGRHAKWDPQYVLGRKPTWIVLNTRSEPVDGQYVAGYWGGETDLVNSPEFQKNYRVADKYWAWDHTDVAYRTLGRAATSYIMLFRRAEDSRRRVGPCLGFERGTYEGWTVTGEAFGSAPAKGPQGYQRVEGFGGTYLADSFPMTDAPAGKLTSAPFVVKGNRIELLVGGGGDPAKVGVSLVVAGERVRTATGRNDGTLRLERWDVGEYRGETARIEIYDNGPGPWGHILVDAICQLEVDDTPAPAPTLAVPGAPDPDGGVAPDAGPGH